MTGLYKKMFLAMMLTGIAGAGFSQTPEIVIRFIGNCGLQMTDGNTHLYIDFPYTSGAYHYMEYDPLEIKHIRDSAVFLFTHKHADHYSRKHVKKLQGKVYGPWNTKDLEKLNHVIPDFSVQAFATPHRFTSRHCSYLVTWHGKRIFISGDTEHAETIAAVSNMDWAFVPAWLLIDANEKNIKIDTKMIGLYHIGPRDHITSGDPKIHLLEKQGEVISIPY